MRASLFRSRAASAFLVALCTCSAARAIDIETVLIGNTGNVADARFMNDGTCCYGSVAYEYRIGKYEVTNDEYAAFLNAVASSNTHQLYEVFMASTPQGGIVQSGGVPNYTYAAKPNMGNKPVQYVRPVNAMRFANWLHNGQPSGGETTATTEDGAYNLTGSSLPLTKNASATWFLPSANEWYKAAYYDPRDAGSGGPPGNSHYWLYATGTLAQPTAATADAVGNIANPGLNTANYNQAANWNGSATFGNVTTVGSAGPLSASYYGTFDQAGNASEINDDVTAFGPNTRTTRGGSYNTARDAISAEVRAYCTGCYAGLRIASVLDPPGPIDEGLDGDYNDNGTVDAADYIVWRKHLGSTSTTLPNDSTPGSVMQEDLTVWRAHFGESSADAAGLAVVVPEPPCAMLLVLSAISALRRMRNWQVSRRS